MGQNGTKNWVSLIVNFLNNFIQTQITQFVSNTTEKLNSLNTTPSL